MTSPRPAGDRTGLPLDLTASLAIASAASAVVAVVERALPSLASVLFREDPSVRATGAAFLCIAYLVAMTARYKSVGTRRLIGRLVALATGGTGVLFLAGPSVLSAVQSHTPGGAIPGLHAAVLAVLSGLSALYIARTSPSRR